MALRLVQRALIGLAGALGYVPTPSTWRDQLLGLNGEFRRSTGDMAFRVSFEAMGIAFGSYGAAGSFRRYVAGETDSLFVSGMCVVIVVLGLYLVSRNGIRYRFASGSVTALTGGGKVLWQEDLAGLKDVWCTMGPTNSFVTLVWPQRKRRIELYASLLRELSSQQPSQTPPS